MFFIISPEQTSVFLEGELGFLPLPDEWNSSAFVICKMLEILPSLTFPPIKRKYKFQKLSLKMIKKTVFFTEKSLAFYGNDLTVNFNA